MNDSRFVHDSVDGARVVEAIIALIRRFIVISDEGVIAAAFSVIHTHCFDAANHAPYLFIRSATKKCGKSTFLDLLAFLVAEPLLTANISVAALFRTIDARHPTVLFDEMDGLAFGARETNEEMRRILNAGFQRGRPVVRCEGDSFAPREFDVFSPKAIAGIRRLPDTIFDRALTIELKMRTKSERVERFRVSDVEPMAARLKEFAATWADANDSKLRPGRACLRSAPPQGQRPDHIGREHRRGRETARTLANGPARYLRACDRRQLNGPDRRSD
jgi:hypothetical protein